MSSQILFVANANIPSLQLSFLTPLGLSPGEGTCGLLTEQDLNAALKKDAAGPAGAAWARERLSAFRPDLIVFCRYSGPHAPAVVEWARANGVPTVFHLDDDLLNVPIELGPAKHAMHNHPDRLAAVRYLLDEATLVYCSTEPLRRRLFGETPPERAVAGGVYCVQDVLAPPARDTPQVVGYMGFDHAHDFLLALPALVRLLEARPRLAFEMFGSIPVPDELGRFGDRIRTIEPVRDYAGFTAKLASLGWTIGICPLAKTPFNAVKADTKWVEYTACGFAVVASQGTVYDRCCSDGCGALAEGDDEWLAAFERLLDDDAVRVAQVERAQDRLRRDYSPERLRAQIGEVFAKAHVLAASEAKPEAAAELPSAVVPGRVEAPSPGSRVTLDELWGDRIRGWAWDPSEIDKPEAERKALELWCGKTRIGTVARSVARPDVDAHVGDPVGAKGFLASAGALVSLWSLFGESAGLEVSLRLGGTAASPMSSGPLLRETAFSRTLRNATDPLLWNAVDLWWANPRLLKIRTLPRPKGATEPAIAALRVMQPMPTPDGGVRLDLVDEQPLRPGGGIVVIGVRSALMPIVLVGRDASDHVVFVDMLPFPSLLRGGLHESELAAMGEEGGTLADLCRLNDSYLAEQTGWSGEAPPHVIGEIAVDLLRATGAETIFDPAVRQWLASVLGIEVGTVGAQERRAADLGDETFVHFARDLLAGGRRERPRKGRARLHLSGDAVPTVGAAVSRRWRLSAAARPGPVLIADEAFPDRRWLVAFPGPLPPHNATSMDLAAIPYLEAFEGAADPETGPDDGMAPLAIVFRDLAPRSDARLLFPVPKDVVDIPVPDSSADPGLVSVLMLLPREAAGLRALLATLANQRVAGGFELLLGAANHLGFQLAALNEELEAGLSGRARVIAVETALRTSETLNRLAAEARGDTLVVLDLSALLHDERTLQTLARIAALPGAGTVGCMLLRADAASHAAPSFLSAGLFPGRVDFALAPHVALGQPDCSWILPCATYAVAANSGWCWAVSAARWREAGGLTASSFPSASAEIDLAVRLAAAGLTNLCTTKVSVLVGNQTGPQRTRDMGLPSHLGLWRILPALQRSTVLRSF